MAERPQYPDAIDTGDVAESMKRLDAEHAVPTPPNTSPSATPGSAAPAAEGMHGMFDGKCPHTGNRANADAAARGSETHQRSKPPE